MTKEKAMELLKIRGIYLTKVGSQLLDQLANTGNKMVTTNGSK